MGTEKVSKDCSISRFFSGIASYHNNYSLALGVSMTQSWHLLCMQSITAYRDKVKKATNTDEVEQYGSLIKNYESSLQHQKKDIAAIEREMKRQNAELGELQKREKRKKQGEN